MHESNKRMIKVEIREKEINDVEMLFRLPTLTKFYPTLHIVIREDGDKSLNISKEAEKARMQAHGVTEQSYTVKLKTVPVGK